MKHTKKFFLQNILKGTSYEGKYGTCLCKLCIELAKNSLRKWILLYNTRQSDNLCFISTPENLRVFILTLKKIIDQKIVNEMTNEFYVFGKKQETR